MTVIVRYECHACGAPAEAHGEQAWLRCGYCRALLGFDWQAWFESPDYSSWLKKAPSQVAAWGDYQKLAARGEALAKKGELEKAEESFREAVEKMLSLSPHVFPPEVQTDRAYRERYLRHTAWAQLQQFADPEAAKLWAGTMDLLRRFQLRDPLATLEPAAEQMGRMVDRTVRIPGAPEDPDGMPPNARRRVSMTQFLSAYLHLLSPAARLKLLERMHGSGNVVVTGDARADEVGLYQEWECPRCGLFSLQPRMATERCCPACLCRRRVGSGREALAETTVACRGCGAQTTLAAGAFEGTCVHCGGALRRLARTGDAERDFARAVQKQYGGPAAESDGLPLEGADFADLQRLGVAHAFLWYGKLTGKEQLAGVLRRNLAGLTGARLQAELAAIGAVVRREGGDEAALAAFEEARRELARA